LKLVMQRFLHTNGKLIWCKLEFEWQDSKGLMVLCQYQYYFSDFTKHGMYLGISRYWYFWLLKASLDLASNILFQLSRLDGVVGCWMFLIWVKVPSEESATGNFTFFTYINIFHFNEFFVNLFINSYLQVIRWSY